MQCHQDQHGGVVIVIAGTTFTAITTHHGVVCEGVVYNDRWPFHGGCDVAQLSSFRLSSYGGFEGRGWGREVGFAFGLLSRGDNLDRW